MTSVHGGITRSPRVLTADFLLFVFFFKPKGVPRLVRFGGHLRTSRRVKARSVHPSTTDMGRRHRLVRLVPQADSCSAAIRSVIRSPCRRGRLVIVDCQVERHRSLMIEMSGYLVGNSTGRSEGLVPLNDLIDIFRGVPEKFVKIRSIRH